MGCNNVFINCETNVTYLSPDIISMIKSRYEYYLSFKKILFKPFIEKNLTF